MQNVLIQNCGETYITVCQIFHTTFSTSRSCLDVCPTIVIACHQLMLEIRKTLWMNKVLHQLACMDSEVNHLLAGAGFCPSAVIGGSPTFIEDIDNCLPLSPPKFPLQTTHVNISVFVCRGKTPFWVGLLWTSIFPFVPHDAPLSRIPYT